MLPDLALSLREPKFYLAMQKAFQKRTWTDLAFISALLGLGAVFLIVLRGNPFVFSGTGKAVLVSLVAALVGSWLVVARASITKPRSKERQDRDVESRKTVFLKNLVWCALLLGVTIVSFYQPLRIHFWHGADDFGPLIPSSVWTEAADTGQNRPLMYMPHRIGAMVTPDRIEGFLWLAVALCFFNGALLGGFLRSATSLPPSVCASAALLLVANRADYARFAPLWASNAYCASVFLLLASLWSLAVSFQRGSRLLLVFSCILVIASLLVVEGGYLLALIGPASLLLKKDRNQVLVWLFAYLGSIGVTGLRFALFLLETSGNSYQAASTSAVLKSPALMIENLKLHLGAPLAYFTDFSLPGSDWPSALLALLLAAMVFALSTGNAVQRLSFKTYSKGIGAAVLALLLGTLPFLPVSGLFRTHFFAAPADAALVAIALGLVGSLFPRRTGMWIFGTLICVLVGHSTLASLREQKAAIASENVYFEKTVHIFNQVHSLSPKFAPGSLIVFVLDDNIPSPLRMNYGVYILSEAILGTPALQANFKDITPSDWSVDFAPGSVVVTIPAVGSLSSKREFRYDQIVAFRLTADGTVSLLERLPTRVLPIGNHATSYAPLALMRPGPVDELQYLRYPLWAEKPPDILDSSPGMILAGNWPPLQIQKDSLFREAGNFESIAVNPMGQSKRSLRLSVRPPAMTGPWELQALDEKHRIIASCTITKRQTVELAVPLEPSRINLFQLRMLEKRSANADDSVATPFRIYCRGKYPNLVHPPGPDPADIVSLGMRLGDNWYPLEHSAGEAFRWVENDAQIVVGRDWNEGANVLLTLEPGPGAGGRTLEFQFIDQRGQIVMQTQVSARQDVRIVLPASAPRNSVYRLHVIGGGRRAPAGEERILNFRVFRCCLNSLPAQVN